MNRQIKLVPFRDQKYEELKKKFNNKNLFSDPLFKPEDKSLCYSKEIPKIEWKRPKEKFADAKFVVDGFNRNDFDQGILGNCWFIAGCVGILQSDKNFSRVVPKDQSFDDSSYNGMFHFRFYRYGDWVDVVIDDYLPFHPNSNRLVYCSNKQNKNEFWTALLEKAYAKLYGCYELLDSGQIADAFVDMTGGLCEKFSDENLPKKIDEKDKFWNILHESFKRESLIGCSIKDTSKSLESKLSNGLITGHAYTITCVCVLKNIHKLVRLRNPWGKGAEWNGPWSDNSKEWSSISNKEKESLGLVIDNDGEFWMCYEDFISVFNKIQFCHTKPCSYSDALFKIDDDSDLEWHEKIIHDEWVIGKSAGGSKLDTFWTNPQYLIRLNDVDDNDNQNLATVIISLMQKDSREKKVETEGKKADVYFQFRLYFLKDHIKIDDRLENIKFSSRDTQKIGDSGSYTNTREATKRFSVKPGNYIIIPSTFDKDTYAKFMLRVYTHKKGNTNKFPKDKPISNQINNKKQNENKNEDKGSEPRKKDIEDACLLM